MTITRYAAGDHAHAESIVHGAPAGPNNGLVCTSLPAPGRHPDFTMNPSTLLILPEAGSGPAWLRARALLFHDPRSARLLDEVERLVPLASSLLIIGQTGTGKELIARHVHRLSGRGGPFIAIHCSSLSAPQLETGLFGLAGGAAGWLEAARGGTLYLDEIGDLPPPLQARLLEVLQQGRVQRSGAASSVAVDVHLVAASSFDLQRAALARCFDAALYEQLGAVTLELPPLRDRPGDILPLAAHFLAVHAARFGLPGPVRLSPEAEQALLAHRWPGNIRELEQTLRCALMVCRAGRVESADLRLTANAPRVCAPTPAKPAHRPPTRTSGIVRALLHSSRRWLGLHRPAA